MGNLHLAILIGTSVQFCCKTFSILAAMGSLEIRGECKWRSNGNVTQFGHFLWPHLHICITSPLCHNHSYLFNRIAKHGNLVTANPDPSGAEAGAIANKPGPCQTCLKTKGLRDPCCRKAPRRPRLAPCERQDYESNLEWG